MNRVLRFLDSKSISRVGAVLTLVSVVGVGLGIVGLMYAEGADLLREGRWITLVCFGIWVLISALVIFAWAARRQPGIVVTPVARVAIAKGLPGSAGLLLAALLRAEATGREFIAEAAILSPINNHRAAYELAQGYAAFESEIGALIESAEVFDERWSLMWARKPSRYHDSVLRAPLTLGMLNELTQYMAHRNRQIGWMIDFLKTGNEEHVRHARAWARADERAAEESSDTPAPRHDVLAGSAGLTAPGS